MHDDRCKQRARCIKSQRKNNSGKYVNGKVYYIKMKESKEKCAENNSTQHSASFVFGAKYASEYELLAYSRNYRISENEIKLYGDCSVILGNKGVVKCEILSKAVKSAEQQAREKKRRQKRRRSRRQKQRMLEEKHAHAEIKANRKPVDWSS